MRAPQSNSQQDKNAPFYLSTASGHRNKERGQCQDHERSHAVTTFTCTLPFLDRQTPHHQHISLSRTTSHGNRDKSRNHFPLLSTRDQSIIFFSDSLSTHANDTTSLRTRASMHYGHLQLLCRYSLKGTQSKNVYSRLRKMRQHGLASHPGQLPRYGEIR